MGSSTTESADDLRPTHWWAVALAIVGAVAIMVVYRRGLAFSPDG